ncbi:MAG: alkaline phosphatase family protein [Candidatus Micrarchaeaceae archaeon]
MVKLYLIGMDSVPLWMLEELRKEEGMETFNMLLTKGLITNLESTLPPMSGPAWPSIYTGLAPKDHGVPDFFVMKKNYTPDVILYDSNLVIPFWKIIADNGKRCLLITPAEEVRIQKWKNIDIITGFPLPAKTNSPKLKRLMEKYNFKGEPDIEKDIKAGKISIDEAINYFTQSIKARSNIAKEAIEWNYDFAYVCFTETDRIQHFLLNQKNWKEKLLLIYREYDKFLSYLIKKADLEGSAIIFLSDHGSQPIKNKFLINSWLINKGYLAIKKEIKNNIENTESNGSIRYNIREKLLKTRLRRVYDNLPYAFKKIIFNFMSIAFKGMGKGAYTRLHLFDYDMEHSKVFAAISNDPVATLWINDNRFVNGIVLKNEVEQLKSKLTKDLKKIKTPEGNQLIVNVFDGKKYYGNTNKFLYADLLIEATKGYTIDIFNFSKDRFFMSPENAKSGDHTRQGIFGYYPDRLKIKVKKISVLDIYNIIIAYFGLNKSKKNINNNLTK